MRNPNFKLFEFLGQTTAGAPDSVKRAVLLLYTVIGISVVRILLTVIRHWEVRTPTFLISLYLVIWTLSLLLVYWTGKGKNWARWILVIILTFSIPLSVLPSLHAIGHTLVSSLLGLTQLALFIWALVLLFQKESADWFKWHKQ